MRKQYCPTGNIGECMQSDCAWWDDKRKQCVVHSISGELSQLQGIYNMICIKKHQDASVASDAESSDYIKLKGDKE